MSAIYFGDCLLVGIVEESDFGGCLSIGIDQIVASDYRQFTRLGDTPEMKNERNLCSGAVRKRQVWEL